MTSVAELIPFLQKLIDIANFESVTVRIGDGAPLIRDRIINDCILQNWIVEQVNETKTSLGLIRNNYSLAQESRQQWNSMATRDLSPTDGEIKYIQTESRKRSNGEITISRSTAGLVALGEMSMDEAITTCRHYSSRNSLLRV